MHESSKEWTTWLEEEPLEYGEKNRRYWTKNLEDTDEIEDFES